MMNEQDMKDKSACDTGCSPKYGKKCMPWGGIVAGALIAVGLSFLLNLFGAAIGLSAFHVSADGAMALGIGGYIGIVIGVVAIMFFAGWVAGFAGRAHCSNPCVGGLYGITAWCLALVITVLIASHSMQFAAANLAMITNQQITRAAVYNDQVTIVVDDQSTNAKAKKSEVTPVSKDKVHKFLTLSLFLTFALFFVGALSSAIGGYCGLRGCCKSSCNKNSCCDDKQCSCSCSCCK